MEKWNMESLGVAVDMAGCPNNCRHCWLGKQKNGNMNRTQAQICITFQSMAIMTRIQILQKLHRGGGWEI
jgi:wyosine [tRNA(Phe)-imidazoG37] synthetase (radical SAM superfamily)